MKNRTITSPGHRNSSWDDRGLYPVLAGWAIVSLFHLHWWSQNLKPLAWDQARHTLLSLRYLEAFSSPLTWPDIFSISIFYPPLFHLSQAFSFIPAGPYLQYAALVNLFWLLLIMLAVWRLGERFHGRSAGVLAAWLSALVPISAGLSREVLLELCLAATVSWTMVVLAEPGCLGHRKGWLKLGLWAGLGLLAKWTYPLFVAVPFWLALTRDYRKDHRVDWVGAAKGILVCLALSLPWYLHSPATLIKRLLANSFQVGAQEGDPGLGSLSGWLFYPLNIINDQLLIGLGLFVLAGLVWTLMKDRKNSGLVLAWFLGGLILVSLLRNKDTRYIYPLVPAACLLMVGWLTAVRIRALRNVLGALALLLGGWGFLGTSFDLPWLSQERAIAVGGAKLRISGHLVGYSQPPDRQDWALPHILHEVLADWESRTGKPTRPPLLGVTPSLPRFHKDAFKSWAAINGPQVAIAPSSLDPWEMDFRKPPGKEKVPEILDRLEKLDYLIIKSGDIQVAPGGRLEALPCTECPETPPDDILRAIPGAALVATFDLPDKSRAFLLYLGS